MLADIKRTFDGAFGWILTVHPIGRKFARIIILLSAISLASYFFTGFTIQIYLFYAFIAIAVFVSFFFRDPKRETVFADDEIACPADGKVLSIRTETDPDVLVIRIFLSIFNVHIQRATITGRVEDVVYTKGTFVFADNPNADKNERNLIKFTNGDRFAHIEQITGAIARRIKAWVKPGDEVKAGQKAGIIYFGSHVAVYMPKDKVRAMVKEGQSVQGALTVLAVWK